MENEKYRLERKSIIVDIKLEKEKTKRSIINVLLYSILSGLGLTSLNNDFDSITDILCLIIMSIIFGIILYFITLLFDGITNFFTETTQLESRKKYIEEELKYKIQQKIL